MKLNKIKNKEQLIIVKCLIPGYLAVSKDEINNNFTLKYQLSLITVAVVPN